MLKMDKELHKQLLAEKKAKAKKTGSKGGGGANANIVTRQRATRKKQAGAAKNEKTKEEANESQGDISIMSTTYNRGYSKDDAFDLSLNAALEGTGEKSRETRRKANEYLANSHDVSLDFAANHELGHMLNYLLIKEKNRNLPKALRTARNTEDRRYRITSSQLVEEALRQTMPPEEFEKLVRYQENSLGDNERWDPDQVLADDEEWATSDADLKNNSFKKGQINLAASNLGAKGDSKGYTTQYGATNASEFFAEAFADVYQNGKEARPTSIKLVQLYEQEMKRAKEANR